MLDIMSLELIAIYKHAVAVLDHYENKYKIKSD